MADAGVDVTLWGRDVDAIAQIATQSRHDRVLPHVTLPESLRATTDAAEALAGADIVAVALPSQVVRTVIGDMATLVEPSASVVSLMKGIEVGSHLRMSEVLHQVWEIPDERLAVVSGPNLAKEIAARQPTATVIASAHQPTAERIAEATASSYFRPYTNPDVVGVELCGAYKNVIAVAVGITAGLGFGHNTTATVITRGLAEIQRMGVAMGANPETFAGLAGVGDLIATCASPLSRNHTLGSLIGQGASLEDALARTGGTAEGATTSLSILDLAADIGVDAPICQAVVLMLHEGQPLDVVMNALLSRPRKAELA
jgi:glycerol-3-phosphate dehydrogenase (NAD(P)+)